MPRVFSAVVGGAQVEVEKVLRESGNCLVVVVSVQERSQGEMKKN